MAIQNSAAKSLLEPFYVDYIGFADLRKYQAELVEFGGKIVQDYPAGICLGLDIPDAIVDHLPQREDNNIACEYQTHGYEVLNERLNLIASNLASFLNRKGFRTLPIPAANRTNQEKGLPTISHKMIAHIAGLGWIGKNCLLITPEHGPRVRWITILTEAPLETVDNPPEQRCGDCTECVKICPTQAIKGRNYELGEPRESRFEFDRCNAYFEKLKATRKYPVCGMCLYVCPQGRNHERLDRKSQS